MTSGPASNRPAQRNKKLAVPSALWKAILDIRSGRKYVWDEQAQAARAALAHETSSYGATIRMRTRLKHRAVADSLEEAGDRLFTFARLPPSQWRSLRTTNAIERLHEEFKRRIKTQTVLPSADTAAMMFWALPASGQISMRKVDGWNTLATKPTDQPIDLAA